MEFIRSLCASLHRSAIRTPGVASRGLLLVLLAFLGCGESGTSTIAPVVDTGPPRRRLMDSLGMDRGLTARSVLSCPAGECIVLHYPVRFVTNVDRIQEFHQNMKDALKGDPDSNLDDGEVLIEEESHWYNEQRLGGMQATFNCCTYAVADVVGLTKSDWISPNPIDATENTIPMKILLDSYFRVIHVVALPKIDWSSLEIDSRIEDGDVFCFVRLDTEGESVGLIREFVHAGRIHRRDGRNWLVSKMGMGPIVRSGLRNTGKLFEGGFNQIRVYRRLPKSS